MAYVTTQDLALATLLQQSATLTYVNDNANAKLDVEDQDLNPIVMSIESGKDGNYAVVTYQILDPKAIGLDQLFPGNHLHIALRVNVSEGAYGPFLALDGCSLVR